MHPNNKRKQQRQQFDRWDDEGDRKRQSVCKQSHSMRFASTGKYDVFVAVAFFMIILHTRMVLMW